MYVATIATVPYEYGKESVERSLNAVGGNLIVVEPLNGGRISRGLKQCGFGVCSQRADSYLFPAV